MSILSSRWHKVKEYEWIISTMGYGNNSPDQFLARLKEFEIDFLFDVRKANSKAWNRTYWKDRIGHWLQEQRGPIWIDYHQLANPFETLQQYQAWLYTDEGQYALAELAVDIETRNCQRPCIMCAELDHHKFVDEYCRDEDVRIRPRVVCCHRVYAAMALEGMLMLSSAKKWMVMHI